jgi:hypothetical protein
MSAIDDFLATQPSAQGAAGVASAPKTVDALLARDATAQSVPPALRAPQVAQSSQPGMLASLGAGLGHGFGSTMLGLQQLAGRGMTALGSDHVGPWLTQDAEHGLANIDQQYAQYSDAHPIVAGTGNVGGQIAGTLPTMAIGPEYAGLSLAGKVGLGAAQGAAGAAMMPVNQPGNDYWTQKGEQVGLGGLMGAATPAVMAGAQAAGQGLWNAIRPVVQPMRYVGEGLANAMDPAEAAAAAQNIRGAQQFVPGSIPTTAQAAQTPVMVQTEKAAANDITPFKTAAMQRASDNNIARWQTLKGVAQDDAAMQAAQKARDAASTPLYDAAHSATANVGPAFMRYAQIPEMQEAMQRADALASLNSATGRGVAPVWPTPQSKTINGAALDYTSRALGDMIGEAQRAGSNTRAGALTALKSQVDNWTNAYIPGVKQADAAYAAGSVPINTMEVGQQIANKLGTKNMIPGIGGGVAELQLNPYRTALMSAMGSGNAAKYGIDDSALNTLQGIGQDLQRQSLSNSVKMGGSDTAYNIGANGWLARNLYGPSFQGATGLGKGLATGAALLTGHPYIAAGVFTGANKLGKMVGGRLEDRLTGLLMDPNTILPYLDARAAASAQSVPGPLMQGLLNYGRPAAVNGLLGGLNNSGNK